MIDLKPSMIYHGRCIFDCGDKGHHDTELLKILAKGTKLYAIPSTHRVVSVEFLKVLLDYIEDCDYARETEDKLRAIIDNHEETK